MTSTAELLPLLTLLCAGGGAAVAGAICSDLKHLAQRLERVESSTERAHDRIDGLMGIERRRPLRA